MEILSSFLKFVFDRKGLVLGLFVANATLYFGPLLKPESFQSLPTPWLQLNMGLGIISLVILILNLLESFRKLLVWICSSIKRFGSKFQIEEIDKEVLIEMHRIYPRGIDIYALSYDLKGPKLVDIKLALNRLVKAGYVQEPYISGSHTITTDGLEKARELLKANQS